MQVKQNIKLKKVCDVHFLIPEGEDNVDVSKMFSLNESSVTLWKRMEKGPFTIDDLVNALLEEYEVTPDQARSDVEEIVNKFIAEGVIIN